MHNGATPSRTRGFVMNVLPTCQRAFSVQSFCSMSLLSNFARFPSLHFPSPLRSYRRPVFEVHGSPYSRPFLGPFRMHSRTPMHPQPQPPPQPRAPPTCDRYARSTDNLPSRSGLYPCRSDEVGSRKNVPSPFPLGRGGFFSSRGTHFITW